MLFPEKDRQRFMPNGKEAKICFFLILCLAFWIGDREDRMGANMQFKTKKRLSKYDNYFNPDVIRKVMLM
jgi:hypothetical protein